MKVLVTGGNGFIGAHLVEALLKQNYQVRCLVLESEPLRKIRDLPVEIVYGDICDPDSLKAAVKDVELVYHLAAIKNAWEEGEFFRVNCEGTKSVFDTALAHSGRLERFVFVSTQAAVGPSEDGHLITEDEPCNPLAGYGQSKRAAEEYLQSMAEKVEVTVLRPTAVYGPLNFSASVMDMIIKAARWRILPQVYTDGPYMNTIHIRDVIEALVLAGVHENAAGQTYFLASERPYSWQEIGKQAFSAWGRRGINLYIPRLLVNAVGGAIKLFRKLQRRPTSSVDGYIAQMYTKYYVYSGKKARRELGFVPRVPLEEGLSEVVTWYKNRGKSSSA